MGACVFIEWILSLLRLIKGEAAPVFTGMASSSVTAATQGPPLGVARRMGEALLCVCRTLPDGKRSSLLRAATMKAQAVNRSKLAADSLSVEWGPCRDAPQQLDMTWQAIGLNNLISKYLKELGCVVRTRFNTTSRIACPYQAHR